MSGLPRKGTKYRIVQIELLIPDHAEMFMDLISDFRDDNPDELVEWNMVKRSPSDKRADLMTREKAIEVWRERHDEDITLEEYDDA